MKLSIYMDENSITQSDVAKVASVTAGRVGHWCRELDEPPPAKCVLLEKWSKGQVTRQDLRPNDWHLIWPELVEEESA